MSGPFPTGDVVAMAALLTHAAPGLSEEKRAAAVQRFEKDLARIVERWEKTPDPSAPRILRRPGRSRWAAL
jgi:hypothetical protein